MFVASILLFGSRNANADFTFGTPVNLGPVVNSDAVDWHSSITTDNLELYFASYRSDGYGDLDIWVITRELPQDPWGPPVNLGPNINSSDYEGDPCPSADGLTLYYVSDTTGLMKTTRATKSDNWGPPVALGPAINTGSADWVFPAISPDDLQLYLSEYWGLAPSGYGEADLWVSTRPDISDAWGPPQNLGPIVNSSAHERYPSISFDGQLLLFSSNRSGGFGGDDMWIARWSVEDDSWAPPVNLGPMVNTSSHDGTPSISSDGSTLYFSSTRHGGYGNSDLYQAPIYPVVDLNGDGSVDAADIHIMADYLGTDEPLCDIGPMPWGDGIVDGQDLIVLANHLSVPTPGYTVIERRISASTDDAEEALNSGYYTWNYSSDLELVHDRIDNGGEQLVGMTFRDIAIMPGEVISNAYIEFVCDEIINGTAGAYFLIWGHLTPNSEGFKPPFVISNRPQTAAKVPWEPAPWDADGQKIHTANIAPILQELIDQPGWSAGNAVEIIIGADPDKPTFTGVRCAESYDGSPSSAPLLHIEIAVP